MQIKQPYSRASYPCSEIKEYVSLAKNATLKSAILKDTDTEESFVERASILIQQQVLGAIPYRGHGGSYDFMNRLRARGYETADISHALALAWLRNEDHFHLQKLGWIHQRNRQGWLMAISVILASVTVLVGILVLRVNSPELAALILWFEPVMAGLGVLIAVVVARNDCAIAQ